MKSKRNKKLIMYYFFPFTLPQKNYFVQKIQILEFQRRILEFTPDSLLFIFFKQRGTILAVNC